MWTSTGDDDEFAVATRGALIVILFWPNLNRDRQIIFGTKSTISAIPGHEFCVALDHHGFRHPLTDTHAAVTGNQKYSNRILLTTQRFRVVPRNGSCNDRKNTCTGSA
uniref:(northern house mosquito) hypothetical protein n=1 Tax=Culex pipiens TaxID=7175 RepID=A0A8D8GMK0_CULPI